MDRRRKTVPAADHDEALQRYLIFKAEVLNEPLKAPELTLAMYVDVYLPKLKSTVSARTYASYEQTARKHLVPALGTLPLAAITQTHILDLQKALKDKGLAPATIFGYINVLLLLLHRAVDIFQLLDAFPIKTRLKRRKPRGPSNELQDAELRRFLGVFLNAKAFHADIRRRWQEASARAAKRGTDIRRFGGPRVPGSAAAKEHYARFRWLHPLFVVAVETGLRRGDLLALRWRSVNIAARRLTVRMEKTRKDVQIPLSKACLKALAECKQRGVQNDRVFSDEAGNPISEIRLRRTFLLARRLAGIATYRFHDLRHQFGTNLSRRGVPIQAICQVMGHHSVTQTERYVHASEADFQAVLRAVDR
ncbi:MAG: tyrosine-type recombinase/integrase [Thermoanaerobaculia bacterium]|nr:tyrosine-type recombinase/integrase [Thermoanaerobaculia bacterium]